MNGEWTHDFLENLVRNLVAEKNRPLLFEPVHHNTKWHEFSLMRHNALVVEAAQRMLVLTGVDVMTAALFHDLGKLVQFDNAVATGDYFFAGHEQFSVELAQKYGISGHVLHAIQYHDISYQHRADRILPKLCGGDVGMLRHLLAIAACDTAGKGWTDAQRVQRLKVAEKFHHVCEMAELDDSFADVIKQACLEW
ncbi:MAG: HD domain-containing protein [Patescibacteria group bacterium]|jgi:putative nucleotidyltransferase with HDIG domain